MPEPKILILRAAGTNCEHETAFALRSAGGDPTIAHVNRLLEAPHELDRYGMLVIPGGFSYGDDLGAGRVFGIELEQRLGDAVRRLVARNGLVLGICNGFQVLVQSGLLPGARKDGTPIAATLTWNDSHRYQDRWVWLSIDHQLCPMAPRGKDRIQLPVAHAEGRFTLAHRDAAEALIQDHRAVFRYVTGNGGPASFPDNPNGSDGAIAGVCDATGRILGLMPHPERALQPWHHPAWTRDRSKDVGDGFALFQAAVSALRA